MIKGGAILLSGIVSGITILKCDEQNVNKKPVQTKPCCESPNKCTNSTTTGTTSVNSTTLLTRKVKKEITKEILTWKESNCVPGVTVCIQKSGETIYNEAFGFSDIENAIPMTTSSKLRIASISKALTSIGLGVLLEQGKIKLEDSIQKYLPTFPRSPSFPDEELTIGQVASHLGGIRHYGKNRVNEFYSVEKFKTKKEYNPHGHRSPLDIFIDNPWVSELDKTKPGHFFSYSTFGYSLLGLVMEEVSGKSYCNFMKENVFTPCGMKNTLPDEHDSLIPNRSKQYALRFIPRTKEEINSNGYNEPRVSLCNAEFTNSSYKYPGGGFVSTATDLCNLGTSLMNGKLLSKSTLTTLFTPNPPLSGKSSQYCIGWMKQTSKNNSDIIYHTGNAVGGTTILLLIPSEQIVVSILANQEKTNGISDFGFKLIRSIK